MPKPADSVRSYDLQDTVEDAEEHDFADLEDGERKQIGSKINLQTSLLPQMDTPWTKQWSKAAVATQKAIPVIPAG